MKRTKRNNKGFSLVELIIVIAIMAILAGVLAPQFVKSRYPRIQVLRSASPIQSVRYDSVAPYYHR